MLNNIKINNASKSDIYCLNALRIRTEKGKQQFSFHAPFVQNILQIKLKLLIWLKSSISKFQTVY